jgi:hypothetical protein
MNFTNTFEGYVYYIQELKKNLKHKFTKTKIAKNQTILLLQNVREKENAERSK